MTKEVIDYINEANKIPHGLFELLYVHLPKEIINHI